MNSFNYTIVIIFIICTIWILWIYVLHPQFITFEYSALKHKFKTGDIILFHALDNINPIFIGSYYGHVGIVYVDPDDEKKIPYIFEAFNPHTMKFFPKENSSGIILAPLEQRLNSYRGYCFYKELSTEICIKEQREFKDFINYAIEHMYYNSDVLLNGIEKLIFNDNIRHGINCGELVYLSLIKLKLLPLECLYKNRKHHLVWLSSENINNEINTKYKQPVYVLSNYFEK